MKRLFRKKVTPMPTERGSDFMPSYGAATPPQLRDRSAPNFIRQNSSFPFTHFAFFMRYLTSLKMLSAEFQNNNLDEQEKMSFLRERLSAICCHYE